MLIACWIGNKATKELYSTSTMPGKILSKFNEENAWFLPQFFVVRSPFIFSRFSQFSKVGFFRVGKALSLASFGQE